MEAYVFQVYNVLGYDAVRKATGNVDIFSFEIIFFPICVNSDHWILVVVQLQKMLISIYDPKYSTDWTKKVEKIVEFLEVEHKR